MSGSSGTLKFRAGVNHRRQQVAQVRCPIHDRLIRRVIANVVVIDDEASIEWSILVGIVKADAQQVLIDGSVDRTVEQRAGELDAQLLGDHGMWVARKYAVVWQAD